VPIENLRSRSFRGILSAAVLVAWSLVGLGVPTIRPGDRQFGSRPNYAQLGLRAHVDLAVVTVGTVNFTASPAPCAARWTACTACSGCRHRRRREPPVRFCASRRSAVVARIQYPDDAVRRAVWRKSQASRRVARHSPAWNAGKLRGGMATRVLLRTSRFATT